MTSLRFPRIRAAPPRVIARSEATKQSIQPTDVRAFCRASLACTFSPTADRGRLTPASYRILGERVFQHREGLTPGFTRSYGCNRLVFYERYERMDEAIARERQIKGGSRTKKIALIEAMNPGWKDLYESLA
jgi:putative endonuclease